QKSAHTAAHTKKCTEPVAPSSGSSTDLRRSGCRSEGHQPRTLRTRCSRDSRDRPRASQGGRESAVRNLRLFLFASAFTAQSGGCSSVKTEEEVWRLETFRHVIRRAGNAFVHHPDRPSASAYSCSGGFVLPAPRARRSADFGREGRVDQGHLGTN